jgi:hypothetical protein
MSPKMRRASSTALRRPYVGCDYSSIIDRIVCEWAEVRRSGIK